MQDYELNNQYVYFTQFNFHILLMEASSYNYENTIFKLFVVHKTYTHTCKYVY